MTGEKGVLVGDWWCGERQARMSCRVRLLPVIDHSSCDTDIRSADFMHLRSAIDKLADTAVFFLFPEKVLDSREINSHENRRSVLHPAVPFSLVEVIPSLHTSTA